MSKFANKHPFALTAIILTATIIFGVMASVVTARISRDVTLQLSGHVVREGKQIPLSEALVAKQGETLHYDLKAQNIGEPVNDFRAIGQIPVGTVLDANSIKVPVEFSLDGKAFSAKPQIEITEKGVKKMVDAPVESYRAVSFKVANGFKGEQSFAYEVVVK